MVRFLAIPPIACIMGASALVACNTEGIDPSDYAACVIERDGSPTTPADGVVDSRILTQFDDAHIPLGQQTDLGADGSIDQQVRYVYDDGGHRIREETGWNRDDIATIVVSYEYDAMGRKIRESLDIDDNGELERDQRWRYDYRGLLVEIITTRATAVVTITDRQVFTHDDNERAVRIDDYRDDVLQSTREQAYDRMGVHLTTLTTSYTGDGLSSLTTYSHDDNGFVADWQTDEGLDGTLDITARCVFDPRGLMLSEEIDRDQDGVPDVVEYYTYDHLGRLLTSHKADPSSAPRVVTHDYDCHE